MKNNLIKLTLILFQGISGNLNENGSHKIIESDTIKWFVLVGTGEALLEEVTRVGL